MVPSSYLLSRLLFCPCGSAMTGHSAKSGRHFYYQCSRKFKQGKGACDAEILPKEKLEHLVIEQLKSRVLTDENLEGLVMLVNEELQSASCGLKDRLDAVDTELMDVRARLSSSTMRWKLPNLSLTTWRPGLRNLRPVRMNLIKLGFR